MRLVSKVLIGVCFALMLVSCPNESLARFDGEFMSAPESLENTTQLPEPAFALSTYDPAFKAPKAVARDGFYSDFNTLDKTFWYVREEKTNRDISDQLSCDGGVLDISARETDRNPFLFGKPLALPADAVVRVKRRARVRYANDYFAGAFYLLACDKPSLPPEAGEQNLGGVLHINFKYDPGRYPTTRGFVAVGDDANKPGGNIVIENAPFGEWIEEELIYNSANGSLVYRLNGKDYSVSSVPLSKPYIRVAMHAYGWYTGHRTEVDCLSLSIESPSGGDSGFGPGRLLGQKTAVPSDKTETYDISGIRISLPPHAMETDQVLSVSELESAGDSLVAWDIELGSIVSFDTFIEVTLPYPDTSGLPGDKQSDKIIAASWDPEAGAWRQEIAVFGKDAMTVRMDHLTTVAVLERGSAPTSEYFPSAASGSQTPDAYVAKAWSAFAKGLELASPAGSLAGLLADFPLLEKLNNSLEGLGNAATLIDISTKLIQGETKEATLATIKAATSWAAGKLAASSYQIASLGTFMIDYSLNTFATEVLESQFSKYEAAYVAYELKYGRTLAQWYSVIEDILAKAVTPQQAKALMDEEFNTYVNRLWTAGELSDEYAEYEILVWEQKGSGLFGITASLTPDVKKKISDNYKEILAQRLSPVFARLAYKARTKLENHYYYTQRELERLLDRPVRIVVGVQGLPGGASVQSALYDGEISLARGSIIQSDGESVIEVPVKKLLKKGVPDAVVIRVARAKDVSFYRKPIRIEQGTTSIEFVLDEMDRIDVDKKPGQKDTSPVVDAKETPSRDSAPSGDTASSRDGEESSRQSAGGHSSSLGSEEQESSAPMEQRGSGGGFTWVFSDDVLTISLSQTTTVDGGTDLIYTLSQSFDKKDMELEGVRFLGYTRLKKESAGQNAYGYDRWTIEEEIKFSMPKTGKPARFFLWVSSKEGSASTYKSSLNLQL